VISLPNEGDKSLYVGASVHKKLKAMSLIESISLCGLATKLLEEDLKDVERLKNIIRMIKESP